MKLEVGRPPISQIIAPESSALLVGTARRDITPGRSIHLGSRNWPPTSTVYQRLEVSAMAIAHGDKKIVLVTADALYFGAEFSRVIRARASAFGLAGDEILLNASHSHGTPALCTLDVLTPDKIDSRHLELFIARTVEAIGESVARLRPARLFLHESECDVAINKRLNGQMVPNPDGPVDRRVRLLVERAPAGELRSVLFLYACHTSDMNDNAFGADIFGFARTELGMLHPRAAILSAMGAGGDARVDHRDPSGIKFIWPKLDRLDETRAFGRRLAASAETALAAKGTEVAGLIHSALREIRIPLDIPRSAEVARAMTSSSDCFQARWGHFMLEKHAQARPDFPTSLPYTIQALRIGPEFLIVGLDGEVFTEIGRAIERRLAPLCTYVFGFSNSIAGYIPPAAEFPRGGYEIDIYYWWLAPAPLAPAVEDVVVNGAVELARSLM